MSFLIQPKKLYCGQMNFARKIIASLFAHVAYGLLRLCGWKRKTVYANLRHVGAVGTACCENSCEGAAAETARGCVAPAKAREETARGCVTPAKAHEEAVAETARGGTSLRSTGNLQGRSMEKTGDETACEKLYLELLHNLTRHVGELLFCFKTFKKLPAEFAAYPCRVDGWNFDLAPGAAAVLEKMRSGGIFLTAHYGNYEAMGPWLCRLGIPLVASYIPVKPAWLNRILEGRIRAVDGRSYSVNARTPREFVRQLADGKLFCLLADQDSRIPSALAGEFMGEPVRNNPLPDFLLKHRPETPVFVCWIEERSVQNARDARVVRILHAEQIPVQTQPLGDDARGCQIARECTESAPFISSESASSTSPSPALLTSPSPALAPLIPLAQRTSVMAEYNAWLEKRIAENPALWYGFTHRRFYSKNPEIYKG